MRRQTQFSPPLVAACVSPQANVTSLSSSQAMGWPSAFFCAVARSRCNPKAAWPVARTMRMTMMAQPTSTPSRAALSQPTALWSLGSRTSAAARTEAWILTVGYTHCCMIGCMTLHVRHHVSWGSTMSPWVHGSWNQDERRLDMIWYIHVLKLHEWYSTIAPNATTHTMGYALRETTRWLWSGHTIDYDSDSRHTNNFYMIDRWWYMIYDIWYIYHDISSIYWILCIMGQCPILIILLNIWSM